MVVQYERFFSYAEGELLTCMISTWKIYRASISELVWKIRRKQAISMPARRFRVEVDIFSSNVGPLFYKLERCSYKVLRLVDVCSFAIKFLYGGFVNDCFSYLYFLWIKKFNLYVKACFGSLLCRHSDDF